MVDSCINADGTCSDRIYQWKPGDESPALFWDSEGSISGWILDAQTHTVWVNALTEVLEEHYDGKSAPVLLRLNVENANVLESSPLSSDGPLHLSSGGDIITETVGQDRSDFGQISFAQVRPSESNALNFMDLAFDTAGDTQWALASLSGLSPDAQHFVYTLNRSADGPDGVTCQLVLSDMVQDSVGQILDFTGHIRNYNFYWSGDSTHFAIGTRAGIMVFDVASGTSTFIGEEDEDIAYWAPSNRYLLSTNEEHFILHDFEMNTATTLTLPLDFWPAGVSFY